MNGFWGPNTPRPFLPVLSAPFHKFPSEKCALIPTLQEKKQAQGGAVACLRSQTEPRTQTSLPHSPTPPHL